MPTLRTNIQKGKFSNYGSSIFATPTKNTQYFKERKVKQPTMRGSFPKAVRYSLDEEGISNARTSYERGMALNLSAAGARRRNTSLNTSHTIATATMQQNVFTRSNFEGNAARRLAPEPEIKTKTKSAPTNNLHAVKGEAKQRSVMQSAALSPIIVSASKVLTAVVIVVACMAFIRVGLTSATVSTGLNSQTISNNIDTELVNKNQLEVQDSALGNTARIRQAASDYSLVAPSAIQTIYLDQDVLAYDDQNNVSLVESLNRVANSTK